MTPPISIHVTTTLPRLQEQLHKAWPRVHGMAQRKKCIRDICTHIHAVNPAHHQGDVVVYVTNQVDGAFDDTQGFIYDLARMRIATRHHKKRRNKKIGQLHIYHSQHDTGQQDGENLSQKTVLPLARIIQLKQWQQETFKTVLQLMADTAQSMEAQTSLRGAMTGLRRLGVMLAAGSVKTKQRVVRQREIVSSVAGLRSNLAGLSDGMRLPSAAQVKIRTQLQKLDKIVPVVAAKIPVVKRVAMPARMIKALRVAVARQGPLKSIALVKHTRCVVPVFLKKLERVVPVKLSMLRTVRHHAIKHIATPLRIMRSIPAVARPAMAKVVPRFVQRFTISRMITAKLPLAVPAVARAIISQTITRPNVVALSPNVKIDGIAPKLFSPAIPHVPVRALRQTARPPALYQPISAISAAVDYRHAVVAPSIARVQLNAQPINIQPITALPSVASVAVHKEMQAVPVSVIVPLAKAPSGVTSKGEMLFTKPSAETKVLLKAPEISTEQDRQRTKPIARVHVPVSKAPLSEASASVKQANVAKLAPIVRADIPLPDVKVLKAKDRTEPVPFIAPSSATIVENKSPTNVPAKVINSVPTNDPASDKITIIATPDLKEGAAKGSNLPSGDVDNTPSQADPNKSLPHLNVDSLFDPPKDKIGSSPPVPNPEEGNKNTKKKYRVVALDICGGGIPSIEAMLQKGNNLAKKISKKFFRSAPA